jgi:hypothetical protein
MNARHIIPHPSSPSITVGHPSRLWRGGVVAHPPNLNPPPPTQFSSPIHGQAGRVTDSDRGGKGWGDEGWGEGGIMPPCYSTWIWRGQTNILGFERKGTLHRL